jgi:hypothetical protein
VINKSRALKASLHFAFCRLAPIIKGYTKDGAAD